MPPMSGTWGRFTLASLVGQFFPPPSKDLTAATSALLSLVQEFRVLGPFNRKIRPIRGGWSIGHYQTEVAGTLGCFVHDKDDAQKMYLLSTADAIAPGSAKKGDAILQPGKIDGGSYPEHSVAKLERWIRPTEETGTSAGIALLNDPLEFKPEIEGLGPLTGTADVRPGIAVLKVGRTSGLTVGKVLAVNLDIKVEVGENAPVLFHQVISASVPTKGGDAGAILVDAKRRALGMLFAGNETKGISFYLPITRVLERLGVLLVTGPDSRNALKSSQSPPEEASSDLC